MSGSVKLSNFFSLPANVLMMEQVLSYETGRFCSGGVLSMAMAVTMVNGQEIPPTSHLNRRRLQRPGVHACRIQSQETAC